MAADSDRVVDRLTDWPLWTFLEVIWLVTGLQTVEKSSLLQSNVMTHSLAGLKRKKKSSAYVATSSPSTHCCPGATASSARPERYAGPSRFLQTQTSFSSDALKLVSTLCDTLLSPVSDEIITIISLVKWKARPAPAPEQHVLLWLLTSDLPPTATLRLDSLGQQQAQYMKVLLRLQVIWCLWAAPLWTLVQFGKVVDPTHKIHDYFSPDLKLNTCS